MIEIYVTLNNKFPNRIVQPYLINLQIKVNKHQQRNRKLTFDCMAKNKTKSIKSQRSDVKDFIRLKGLAVLTHSKES